MSLEDKENSQEDFISDLEHKNRLIRIIAFACDQKERLRLKKEENKLVVKNKSYFEEIDNNPNLEPIPDISHLKKK